MAEIFCGSERSVEFCAMRKSGRPNLRSDGPVDRAPSSSASIKQILPPLIVALAKQAHQVAAGVKAEGTRGAGQAHASFLGCSVAFAVVAVVAAGN